MTYAESKETKKKRTDDFFSAISNCIKEIIKEQYKFKKSNDYLSIYVINQQY